MTNSRGNFKLSSFISHISSLKQFTLIELLVVIAIIAVLAGMLIPSLGKAKQKARLITCAGNQRQMHVAFTMYTNDFEDFMPGNPSGSKAYYYRQLQSYLNDVAVFTDCRIQNAPGSIVEGYAMDNYRNVAYGASWYTVPRSQYLKVGKITKPGSKILFGDSRTKKQSGSSDDDNPTSISSRCMRIRRARATQGRVPGSPCRGFASRPSRRARSGGSTRGRRPPS